MNPAMSVVLFTTLAGAAQGLVVAVAALAFGGALDDPAYATSSLAVAEFLLVAGWLHRSATSGARSAPGAPC